MKTFVIAGALALVGMGLAGTAAADCESGSLGLADYDYYSLCTFETYEYSYPPYYEYSQNSPLNAYYYGYGPGEYTYSSAYLAQYQSEYNWGSPETSTGTNGGVNFYRYSDGESLGVFTYFGQNSYDSDWYTYRSFDLGAGYQAGGEYQQFNYNQYDFNDQGCQEQLNSYSSQGYEQLIAPQPCTAEVPDFPEFPSA